jgi:CelD/BcsL family acetyltransferase involved in cellulose biosynthesis
MTTTLVPKSISQAEVAVAAGPAEPASKLRFRTLPARQLGAELTQAWSAMQQGDLTLQSPFFRPEYSELIATVRPDVFVTVALNRDEPLAFFPFQKHWRIGSPVGGALTDYQGAIARPGVQLDPRQLLRACGLASWRFDHLLSAQQQFAPYGLLQADSPCIDLSCGVENYIAQRRHGCRSDFSQLMRKQRKIHREVGTLRLELHSADPLCLASLIEWKSAQYRQTRTPNIFEYPWVRQVLDRALATRTADFEPCFTSLWAGDALVALILGLRSATVYHSWMTTYNSQFSSYSPGKLVLLELVQAAPSYGIRTIDLGRGREAYKQSFANVAVPVSEGIVELRPATRWLRRQWIAARERVRESPHRETFRAAWSWFRPLRDWVKYR